MTLLNPMITFDEASTNEILFFFDKSTDPEGFVTDMDGKRIIAMDGKEIKSAEIGGIIGIKGIPTLFRNDICSLIEVLDIRKTQNDNRSDSG